MKIRARLQMLATENGGRYLPILDNYRPDWKFLIASTDSPRVLLFDDSMHCGRVLFCDDRKELAPGAEGLVVIEPLVPEHWVSIVPGSSLAMHEGLRVVGYATVVEVAHA